MRERKTNGVKRQYASRGCFFRDPARRVEVRAMLESANKARKARIGKLDAEKTERFPTKAAAYRAGYLAGYNRAYTWWKAAKAS